MTLLLGVLKWHLLRFNLLSRKWVQFLGIKPYGGIEVLADRFFFSCSTVILDACFSYYFTRQDNLPKSFFVCLFLSLQKMTFYWTHPYRLDLGGQWTTSFEGRGQYLSLWSSLKWDSDLSKSMPLMLALKTDTDRAKGVLGCVQINSIHILLFSALPGCAQWRILQIGSPA